MLFVLAALAGAARWPRMRRHFSLWNSNECELCKYVGMSVQVYHESGTPEEQITQIINVLCDDVVAEVKQECYDLRDRVHDIIAALDAGEGPLEMCQKWGYC